MSSPPHSVGKFYGAYLLARTEDQSEFSYCSGSESYLKSMIINPHITATKYCKNWNYYKSYRIIVE